MNRIICDICGSEYPETDERCPICNYPRQGNEKLVAAAAAEAGRTKVKGGRFSSRNVKKRQKAQKKAAESPADDNPNKPLILVIVVLLIAIALVSLYIGMRFFRGRDSIPGYGKPQTTASTTLPTVTTVPPTVPCVGIVLDSAVLDLETLGEQKQLGLLTVPENSTDVLTFQSADPAVAEVSETGLVTAVGSGQTTITITCGTAVKTCTVVCWFQEETTAPTEIIAPEPTQPKPTEPKPTQPKPTEPKGLTLDQNDVSCFTQNEVFTLYVKLGGKSISRSDVTWTSSDPSIASVENGTVTALAKGTVTVTAAYNGQTASCTVRCRFNDTAWKASASDVTISEGESFQLNVTNSSGETANAIWTMSTEGIVSIEGKTITGRAPGTVTLTATVDGVTLTCIVRVR